MLKLISSELDQSDQVHTPSCPDRGQSLNQRGSGPHRQRLYTRHVNQNLPRSEIEHIHMGLITQECCSGGIHHCRPHPPFFLIVGATSGSCASPTVWTHVPSMMSYGSRLNINPRSQYLLDLSTMS
jgi:hypothetical protein